WSAGPQYRSADGGDLRRREDLEYPYLDRQAQPLALRGHREPSAAGSLRPPPQAALHDAGADAPAELHPLRLAPGCAAGLLSALPRQQHAGSLWNAGHADPSLSARLQEHLRRRRQAVMPAQLMLMRRVSGEPF